MEKILLLIIALTIIILIVGAIIYRMLAKKVGDCKMEWADGYLKVEDPVITGDNRILAEFAIPIKSAGKQQCLVIDMTARIHPEGDRYLSFDNSLYVYPGGNRRRDRYFEATLIKPGDTMILKGELTLWDPDTPASELLKKIGTIPVDIFHKTYCRNKMSYGRKILNINISDDISEEEIPETIDKGAPALPVRTPLLVPGHNIYGVFEKYAKKFAKPGDILAVCESALAIMEDRASYVEDVKPGFLATHLNKLFKMDSSLSSPYSLQKAIEEVGAIKIITSVIVGALGRLIGRAGDFYAFAGRAVATIDDCTGTLPPFDKYVVMGPKDPKKSAEEFKSKTGFDLAVVDVNDLGKVDVLGLSCPERKQEVVDALIKNPQGNANEQTPIALIRKKA